MSGNKSLGLLLCLSLVACGGGGGDAPTASGSIPATTAIPPSATAAPSAAKSVSGVAAYGAALANADIIIKGANGKTVTAKADANGKWTVADVSGLNAPLIIQAKGTVGGVTQELYSVLSTAPTGPVTANVTPLTTALLSQAAGVTPAALFADPAKIVALSPAKVEAAKAKLKAALSDYMTALGVDASKVDLISTTFEANSKGLDKLMDLVKVSSSGTGDATAIVIKDHGTGETVEFKAAETPKKLSKPSVETQNLNLAGIRDLIAKFNALAQSKDGVMSSDFATLWDDAFLDDGITKAQDVSYFREEYKKNPNLVWKITLLDIKGCVKDVCKLDLKFESSKGDIEVGGDNPVRQNAAGKWLIYGNQQQQKRWDVNSYKVYGYDGSLLDQSPFSMSEKYAAITIANQTIQMEALDGGNLKLTGWNGTYAHKVDRRAIMLCNPVSNGVNPSDTAKYVLLANTSQAATLNDLKGARFEHNEGCGYSTSTVAINASGEGVFTDAKGSETVPATDIAKAFSPSGLDTGDEVIYLKAFKVFYPGPEGYYWHMVVERTMVKADPSKSYLAWWKETVAQ
ncbi:hypothetical protein NT239_11510 [Chitinibacter sp. SCUT-21]|uniref:hypothetical protein n=1 Tax=Chitinibacter sp. SCUT-21 TaxID=2970891 RepID=UPI0035A69BF9